MPSTRISASQVVSYRPDGTGAIWLGSLGHVSGLTYSYSYPGGCDALACTLGQPPEFRSKAMDVGRIIKVFRGGSFVWDGQLDEGTPDVSGWQLTAHGSGTFGAQFLATWVTYNLNDPLTYAIERGLRWTNPGISQGWVTSQPPDNLSETVTDHLNNIAVQAGLQWYIGRRNILSVGVAPNTVNRLLVCTTPVARTVVAEVNRIYGKYVVSDDGNGNQVYSWVLAANQPSINAHQPNEQPVDLTQGNSSTSTSVMTSTAALAACQNVLNMYEGASYAGPFVVRNGQWLTPGGAAIDLGTDQAGTVARLLVTDGGYGGEVIPSPVAFVVGEYEYDDDAQTATITPWQSYRTDFASLLTAVVPGQRT
jgi:hypothetical protein